MSASALICLAPGSEETEAVTTIDLLVRGGIKVTTASVASDGTPGDYLLARRVNCWPMRRWLRWRMAISTPSSCPAA